MSSLQDRTIDDFGRQWQSFRDNQGHYGSLELFREMFAPFVAPEDIAGKKVADIGSGSGRIVNMLLAAGAAHVTAVEPSAAFEVLAENTRAEAKRVTLIRATGERLPPSGDLDYVISYGVVHHIPDPLPVIRAALEALRPGGRIVLWVYAREGNRLYLAVVEPLRRLTSRLPHRALAAIVWLLYPAVWLYIHLCRVLPLPMRRFMRDVMLKLDGPKRRLNVYDQLNPAYAKYYTRPQALELLRSGGFAEVEAHHRSGYSWTVTGTRPPRRSGV